MKVLALINTNLVSEEDVNFQAPPFDYFGSDFVGRIVAKGYSVDEFDIGQRVIPNCAYPDPPFLGVAPGAVTNEASKGWLRLHKSKLIKIPEHMNNAVAAGFSIGSQTSTSMVRRVNLKQNERALVLSGRSNTSMFIINNLISKGIDTTILTTSDWTPEEQALIRPAKLHKIDRNMQKWEEDLGEFDVIFDPYFDLHLEKAVNQMKVGGRYITCGYKNQHTDFSENEDEKTPNHLKNIMLKVMLNNLSLIGNCIGTWEDLEKGISDYNENEFIVPIDRSYSIEEGSAFVDRTYNTRGRLGKAIMLYD
ncbi:NADPH:quinone reductase-like Zn-dependent oxidoreductase [Staphylococcus capitis]|uniref:zinc-binding alcohol dehydrogenase family protein n=1 Tax=Staphylococcus capitis TaxID=29388 RepID=UPI0007D8EC0F|nr:zinc-binding alcohol dehydrogenase family protein [Staphylococcus capitis]MBC3049052.1 zinc-binding alcohol dehydrogenase family protein [Staphylococcus capitis]MBC3069032.1 zinc-binding alcohol dehydrogenase family protein [Staphylococcus capitis]MCM3283381.1 zinc-binding alcohol dehydrogenase family protein [Staphylococcus capitis]MDS4033424.1 zinc-binding alcohol dehydrogenase family protein [Staphylococcus capitis]OAN24774.1 alcohol dehydrogenase [Staphylococcus capitis]